MEEGPTPSNSVDPLTPRALLVHRAPTSGVSRVSADAFARRDRWSLVDPLGTDLGKAFGPFVAVSEGRTIGAARFSCS